MRRFYCDKCKKEMDYERHFVTIEFITGSGNRYTKHYVVCTDCWKEAEWFMAKENRLATEEEIMKWVKETNR